MQKNFIVDINQKEYPLQISKYSSSKRITLRFNVKSRKFKMSMPAIISDDEALKFFNKHYDWALKQVSVNQINLASCDAISFKGEDYQVLRCLDKQNKVEIDDFNKIIMVYSYSQNLQAEVLTQFLKYEAKQYFYELSKIKAKQLQVNFKEVVIMDNVSNWGSCTSELKLSYNFRLIAAPYFVIDYIVAHEVAHLKEFNHSDRFWQTVQYLTPYCIEGKQWLKAHGKELY